jgi:uncharacterized protein YggU (UPF0235/DUF167 family)
MCSSASATGRCACAYAAPPIEGAANRALLTFLAATLDLPRRDLTLLADEKGRHKRVLVRGLTGGEVLTRLRTEVARGREQ